MPASDELAGMVLYEAMRNLETEAIRVRTPLAETDGVRIARPPLVVPVLRAGLGMLGPVLRLLPGSDTGFIGVSRNEETFQPEPYMNSVPDDLDGRPVLVLDPMLATGGSLDLHLRAAGRAQRRPHHRRLHPRRTRGRRPPGRQRSGRPAWSPRRSTTTSTSTPTSCPGLGDAGDRLFGTA